MGKWEMLEWIREATRRRDGPNWKKKEKTRQRKRTKAEVGARKG